MKITGNEPAMPVVGRYADKNLLEANGLTIRQHFAAMAMQAVLSAKYNESLSEDVELAVRAADALIAELNIEQENVNN